MTKNFVLDAVDTDTGCVAEKYAFTVDDLAILAETLDIDVADLDEPVAYDIDHAEALILSARFKFEMADGAYQQFRLRSRHRIDDLPYEVHTNRELLLMLAGRKPFAHFSFPDIPEERVIVEEIERYFEPHVTSGTIIKRIWINPKKAEDGMVTSWVFYALPNEEWRIEAFICLILEWNEQAWNASLERREGELLGYSPSEMDFHMSHWKRP